MFKGVKQKLQHAKQAAHLLEQAINAANAAKTRPEKQAASAAVNEREKERDKLAKTLGESLITKLERKKILNSLLLKLLKEKIFKSKKEENIEKILKNLKI